MNIAKLLSGCFASRRPGPPPLSTPIAFGSPECNTLELWMGRLRETMERFNRWLAEQRDEPDPWPSFGEFVRSALYECCGAMMVTPYRIAGGGKELRALRDANPLVQTDCISARRGIVGHVLSTGRSYVAGAASNGTLVETLADDADKAVAWCFVIQRGTEKLGVVMAGQVTAACAAAPVVLSVAERLIAQCWLMAADAQRMRTLEQFDPVCELLSRPAFLESAQEALNESYQSGDPVAVAVLALEGLRSMNDSGRWEIADDLLRNVSRILRTKVRSEDRLGRFDGSRFAILLRRVDSELAALIVRQLMAQLTTVCGDSGRWGATIRVRCGLAGSGTSQPTLRDLVSRAISEAQRARSQNRQISTDVVEPSPQESNA